MIIGNNMNEFLSIVFYTANNKRQLGDEHYHLQVSIYSIGWRWFRAQPSNSVSE